MEAELLAFCDSQWREEDVVSGSLQQKSNLDGEYLFLGACKVAFDVKQGGKKQVSCPSLRHHNRASRRIPM